VPRQVQPNGDTVEGHWLTFSLTPPAEEKLEPVKPMPRAPKAHFNAKPTVPAGPQVPNVTPQLGIPQATAPVLTPTPVLPSGMTPRAGAPRFAIEGQ
jgi:hypothetical protein